jgi:hypothetical protein
MLVGGGAYRPSAVHPFAKVTTMLASLYGPAGDIDATEARLFACGCEQLFAVSHDQSGTNLPPNLCPEGWQFRLSFALGVREAMPVAIAPEPILRGLVNVGYYIWREGRRNPSGTTQ